MRTVEPVTVVGVALLSGEHPARVLAARRAAPAALAGRWELPGGKCEPGESLADAAAREVAEELGCAIRVLEVLPHAEPVRPGLVLRVVTAVLVAGDPVPAEHDALRWVGADRLEELDWLAPDVPFLPLVRARLDHGRTEEGE